MTLHELRQRKAEAISAARAIHTKVVAENRDMTADEQAAFEKHQADAKRTQGQIDAEEAFAEHDRTAAAAAPVTGRNITVGAPAEAELVADLRKKPSIKGVSQINSPKVFKSFGEQLMAVRDSALHGGRRSDPRLTAGPDGINEATPSEGGFLVQTDFVSEILQGVYTTGQISSRVKRRQISVNANSMTQNAVDERSRQNGSRRGGLIAYWQNEADTLRASKPKFRQMKLTLSKLTALVYVTDENLQDASYLNTMISEDCPEEINFRVEDAILNGLGDGQPLGVLNPASQSLIVVPKDTNQAAGTLTYNNILNMYSRMIASSRANAVWLVEQSVEPQLFALNQQGTAGGIYPVYLPPGGISGSPYGTLFGRPVIAVEQAATLGLQGDFNFVDLSQYLLADKGDIQTASSMHVRFLEDEMVFRFIYRVDGQPIWNFPVIPFAKNAPTRSPYVTLAARQ